SEKAPGNGRCDGTIHSLIFHLLRLLGRPLERGSENIAERRAGIGRSILGDRFFLLGDLQRLDRHRDLAGAAIELRHAGVDLLADSEAFRTLLGAVAGELRALDERSEIGADDLYVDSGFLHLGDLAGDDRTLLEVASSACFGKRIAFELLDTERNAFL